MHIDELRARTPQTTEPDRNGLPEVQIEDAAPAQPYVSRRKRQQIARTAPRATRDASPGVSSTQIAMLTGAALLLVACAFALTQGGCGYRCLVFGADGQVHASLRNRGLDKLARRRPFLLHSNTEPPDLQMPGLVNLPSRRRRRPRAPPQSHSTFRRPAAQPSDTAATASAAGAHDRGHADRRGRVLVAVTLWGYSIGGIPAGQQHDAAPAPLPARCF